MTTKNFSIKNVKTFMGHEGHGLSCTLYVDKVRTCEYLDDAHGGGGYITQVFNREKYQELQSFILRHEPVVVPKGSGMGTFFYKYNIDNLINDLFNAHQKEKDERKLRKLMERAIIIMNKNDSNSYRYLDFRKPLGQVNRTVFLRELNKVKCNLKKGEYIANNNIVMS